MAVMALPGSWSAGLAQTQLSEQETLQATENRHNRRFDSGTRRYDTTDSQ